MGKRFWEIDFSRGVAVITMIVFHVMFDLAYFGVYPVDVNGWKWLAVMTASVFIFLAGTSLSISRARNPGLRRHVMRGLKVFGLGLVATLVTWLFVGRGFVVFGILHFIGASVILGALFAKLKLKNMLLGLAAIFLGLYLQSLTVPWPWLLWLGLMPAGFYSVDYFPLLPWFGIFLFGLAAGSRFYGKGKRSFSIPDFSRNVFVKPFCLLGRHSLIIYLLHQVIIVGLLWLIF